MEEKFPRKQFLFTRIDPVENSFSSKANLRRNRLYYASLGIAVLAAANALLLGLKLKDWDEVCRIAALFLSAFISVVNFYIGFHKDKQMWIVYNDTANNLRALKLKIDAKTIVNDLSQEDFDTSLLELQKILDGVNQYWTSQHKS